MKQQINLYQTAFRRRRPAFSAYAMALSWFGMTLALVLAWTYAGDRSQVLDGELAFVQRQESATLTRLEQLSGALSARDSDEGMTARLDEAVRVLALKERLLETLSGDLVGDIAGFSRQLESLARQTTGGLWLERVTVSSPGGRTTLHGRAHNPEKVPLYLQSLASEEALTGQRFTRFEILRKAEERPGTVLFSMSSEASERFAQNP